MKSIIFILLLASICFGQIDLDSTSFYVFNTEVVIDTSLVWAVVAKNIEVVSIVHYWEEAYYGPKQAGVPINICVFEQIYKVANSWSLSKTKYYTKNWKEIKPVIVFDFPQNDSPFWTVPSVDTVRYQSNY